MQTCSSPSKKLFKYSFFLFHLSFQLHLMSLLKHPSSGNYALNNNLSILGFYVSVLKEISCTLLYSSNGNSSVLFKRAKKPLLVHQSIFNEEALAWRLFPSFQPQHNTVDTLDADENTKIKFSHKERLIYTLLYFVACNYSFPSMFCTRREKKIPFTGSEVPEVYSASCWLFCFPWKLFLLLHSLKT